MATDWKELAMGVFLGQEACHAYKEGKEAEKQAQEYKELLENEELRKKHREDMATAPRFVRWLDKSLRPELYKE